MGTDGSLAEFGGRIPSKVRNGDSRGGEVAAAPWGVGFSSGISISGGMSLWWGTELDLGRRQTFDQDHRAAAKRAMPEGAWLANRVGMGRQGLRDFRCGHGKQLFAKGNKQSTATAGQKTEVPDTNEPPRQNM